MHVGVGVSRNNEMTCPNETWCQIEHQYETITVSKGQSGRIICTIPRLLGRDVFLLNQYGDPVLDELQKYVKKVWDGSSDRCNHAYHFNVTWVEDRDIQEKLRVIQCRANFQGIPYTYSSAMVSINFATGEQGVSLLQNYVKYTKLSSLGI